MTLLALLFLKHFIVDFILQDDKILKGKGIYGERYGIYHAFQHGLGTFIVCGFFISSPMALFFLVFDGVLHYHFDYLKAKYGEKDITKKQFWTDLGLDQFAHAMTYIAIAGAIL